MRGLQGWRRTDVHVIVPGGARIVRPPGLRMRVHWSGDWSKEEIFNGIHALAPALALSAGTLPSPRPAAGLLAAGVQQRLTTAADLRDAVDRAPRLRHRRALLLALDDIAQGAHALSEI